MFDRRLIALGTLLGAVGAGLVGGCGGKTSPQLPGGGITGASDGSDPVTFVRSTIPTGTNPAPTLAAPAGGPVTGIAGTVVLMGITTGTGQIGHFYVGNPDGYYDITVQEPPAGANGKQTLYVQLALGSAGTYPITVGYTQNGQASQTAITQITVT